MADEDQTRARILDAAVSLLSRDGLAVTSLERVAKASGVSRRTMRRLYSSPTDLIARVMASRTRSAAASRVERAAADPDGSPPMSVLLEVAHMLFTAPHESWPAVDLEALARAGTDDDLRDLELGRMQRRIDNARSVVAQSSDAGGLDPAVSQEAVVHLLMAMSVGLAMLDPVAQTRPTARQWDALMARIGEALGPADLVLAHDSEMGARWRLRIDVPDVPGGMSRTARALAALHVHTVYLQAVGRGKGMRTIDMGLLAPTGVPAEAILAAAEAGGRNAHLAPGGPNETDEDLLTRTLNGATHLVKHPDAAPQVVAALVAADEVAVIDATEGLDDRSDVLRLQWTPTRHVVLQRRWAPFARTEQARASAVLRLSSAIAHLTGDDDSAGWIDEVRDGTIWIRLARPEDADAVAAMHDRSSATSRYQRYFALTQWRDVQLRRLAGGHRGASLVVMSHDGRIIGLGNVFPEGAETDRTAEIALIVEDAHQGTGVGTVLLRRMLQVAERMGFTSVVAHVLADNHGMRHVLGSAGLTWATTVTSGVATMTAALPAT